MKNIKAILCDYDGTLVDHDGNCFPEVKILIKKILNKGIRFSLATGRAYYSSIKRIEALLDIPGIHILHGGAMIFDSINNKILFLQAISNQSIGKVVKYLSDNNLIFSLEAEDRVYISEKVTSDHYPDIENRLIKDFGKSEPILKMVIYASQNQLSEKAIISHIDNLKKICPDISVLWFNFRGYFGADITSEKATKHTAVLEYLKILDLTPEDVVAIGDGSNDYPLFTACGFGIAMANAPKELKDIAGLVVPSVKEGGMVEALKYIDANLI